MRAWWVGLHFVGAMLVPFVLVSAYSSRVGASAFNSDNPYDSLTFCLAVLAGLLCALRVLTGSRPWKKVVTALLYVPTMTVALFVYGAWYVCLAHRVCM
ncbi:MAG TPA: hypothetical protein VM490_07625 [Armatimonadaceae bacterium]|nr:hypothetical protein [Armatimonadaceae bacterium]